jgi:hypothetical protein
MALRAGDRVCIIAGINRNSFGTFVEYRARFYCKVLLDGRQVSQGFMRTSVIAAMVDHAQVAPPAHAVPAAVAAVPENQEGPRNGPPDPRIQELLSELDRVKSALSVLEAKLGAMVI